MFRLYFAFFGCFQNERLAGDSCKQIWRYLLVACWLGGRCFSQSCIGHDNGADNDELRFSTCQKVYT